MRPELKRVLRVSVPASALLALIACVAGCADTKKSSQVGASPTQVGLTVSATSAGTRHIFNTTTVTTPRRTLTVEFASTEYELHTGLEGRTSLAPDSGMLYAEPVTAVYDGQHNWWQTTGYKFPIDIVWIDEVGRVAGLTEGVAPSEVRYTFPSAVRYILELNAGAARRLGIVRGSQLRSPGFLSANAAPGQSVGGGTGGYASPTPTSIPMIIPYTGGRTTCDTFSSNITCRDSNGGRTSCDQFGSSLTCRNSDGGRTSCDSFGSSSTCRYSDGSRSSCDRFGDTFSCRNSDGSRSSCDAFGASYTCRNSDGSRTTCDAYGGSLTCR